MRSRNKHANELSSRALEVQRYKRDDSVCSLEVYFGVRLTGGKSYLPFDDKEFKRFLAAVVGQRHRRNEALCMPRRHYCKPQGRQCGTEGYHTRQCLGCSVSACGCSLLPPGYHCRIGRTIRFACGVLFERRST